jgi:heme-degrading monooxygenase HmoA
VPALPWKSLTTPDPEATYVAMATYLPLTKHRHVPKFLAQSMQVRKQLATSEGLVGYALDARIPSKRFRTVSVWESEAALRAFARAEPHAGIMRSDRARMGPTKFATWTVSGRQVPVSWADAQAHLDEPQSP